MVKNGWKYLLSAMISLIYAKTQELYCGLADILPRTAANLIVFMAGFIGKEKHAVDEKGRLMIPARFRRRFGMGDDDDSVEKDYRRSEELYIMKAPDHSLELYEPFIWAGTRKTISALSDFNPEERLLKTLMYESLEVVDLDRQGRIALSKEFLEHAGITKDVVIIGADTKMIIWDPDRLLGLLDQSAGRFATLAGRYF